MGVVNVTPDSFSDGGAFFSTESAIAHARRLVGEGADLLDIGGESTRPGAAPVLLEEELRRVLPVLEAIGPEVKVPISIDTMKPQVARAALGSGASIINDVSANREDPAMWQLAVESRAGYIAMHMQGTPQTMHLKPAYTDVLAEVDSFFGDRLKVLNTLGLHSDQIVLDAGIGFGKNAEHNLRLLAGWQTFVKWRRPLVLGVSRKSFIGHVTGATNPGDRLSGSLACACWGLLQGVNIVRTHDVAATRQALRMTEAILAHQVR